MVKNQPANAGDARDASLIPGSGRSPGEGNSKPHQYSCLGNSMDRAVWCATVHGVARVRHDWIHTHHLCKMIGVLTSCIVLIISQYVHLLNHHLYTLNSHKVLHELYPNKTGKIISTIFLLNFILLIQYFCTFSLWPSSSIFLTKTCVFAPHR